MALTETSIASLVKCCELPSKSSKSYGHSSTGCHDDSCSCTRSTEALLELKIADDEDDVSPPGSDGMPLGMLELKSVKPYKTQDEYLYAMREDLADWFNRLYDLHMTCENFFELLETGVVLCQHANNVRDFMIRWIEKRGSNECKTLAPSSPSTDQEREDVIAMLQKKVVTVNLKAKPGTFQSRDNLVNFLSWCRLIGVPEVLLFETSDLVIRKNERNVILCLLEIARRGARYGVPAPMLVQMEVEIDQELSEMATQAQQVQQSEERGTGSVELNERNKEKVKVMGVTTREVQSDNCDGGPFVQKIFNDLMSLDEMVRALVSRCTCPEQFPMVKVGEGKYMIGESQTLIFVRILRNHVMVRIGGGWDTLENYLDRHDPCRCKSQGHKNTKTIQPTPASSQRRHSSVVAPSPITTAALPIRSKTKPPSIDGSFIEESHLSKISSPKNIDSNCVGEEITSNKVSPRYIESNSFEEISKNKVSPRYEFLGDSTSPRNSTNTSPNIVHDIDQSQTISAGDSSQLRSSADQIRVVSTNSQSSSSTLIPSSLSRSLPPSPTKLKSALKNSSTPQEKSQASLSSRSQLMLESQSDPKPLKRPINNTMTSQPESRGRQSTRPMTPNSLSNGKSNDAASQERPSSARYARSKSVDLSAGQRLRLEQEVKADTNRIMITRNSVGKHSVGFSSAKAAAKPSTLVSQKSIDSSVPATKPVINGSSKATSSAASARKVNPLPDRPKLALLDSSLKKKTGDINVASENTSEAEESSSVCSLSVPPADEELNRKMEELFEEYRKVELGLSTTKLNIIGTENASSNENNTKKWAETTKASENARRYSLDLSRTSGGLKLLNSGLNDSKSSAPTESLREPVRKQIQPNTVQTKYSNNQSVKPFTSESKTPTANKASTSAGPLKTSTRRFSVSTTNLSAHAGSGKLSLSKSIDIKAGIYADGAGKGEASASNSLGIEKSLPSVGIISYAQSRNLDSRISNTPASQKTANLSKRMATSPHIASTKVQQLMTKMNTRKLPAGNSLSKEQTLDDKTCINHVVAEIGDNNKQLFNGHGNEEKDVQFADKESVKKQTNSVESMIYSSQLTADVCLKSLSDQKTSISINDVTMETEKLLPNDNIGITKNVCIAAPSLQSVSSPVKIFTTPLPSTTLQPIDCSDETKANSFASTVAVNEVNGSRSGNIFIDSQNSDKIDSDRQQSAGNLTNFECAISFDGAWSAKDAPMSNGIDVKPSLLANVANKSQPINGISMSNRSRSKSVATPVVLSGGTKVATATSKIDTPAVSSKSLVTTMTGSAQKGAVSVIASSKVAVKKDVSSNETVIQSTTRRRSATPVRLSSRNVMASKSTTYSLPVQTSNAVQNTTSVSSLDQMQVQPHADNCFIVASDDVNASFSDVGRSTPRPRKDVRHDLPTRIPAPSSKLNFDMILSEKENQSNLKRCDSGVDINNM